MLFLSTLVQTFHFKLYKDVCSLLEGSTTGEIREYCHWSGGYLPTYEDIVQPQPSGTLFVRGIDIFE